MASIRPLGHRPVCWNRFNHRRMDLGDFSAFCKNLGSKEVTILPGWASRARVRARARARKFSRLSDRTS
jgi:hypothetical protein